MIPAWALADRYAQRSRDQEGYRYWQEKRTQFKRNQHKLGSCQMSTALLARTTCRHAVGAAAQMQSGCLQTPGLLTSSLEASSEVMVSLGSRLPRALWAKGIRYSSQEARTQQESRGRGELRVAVAQEQ